MKLKAIFLIFLFGSLNVLAASPGVSAARDPNVDYRAIMMQYQLTEGLFGPVFGNVDPDHVSISNVRADNPTAYQVSYANFDASKVAQLPTHLKVADVFADLRDSRFIPGSNNFLRRPSWLFPDDGCFARAEMMNQRLQSKSIPKAQKIFVFGNLNLPTKHSLSGTVHWWYHVAPIYRVNNQVLVFDPAVSTAGPITLENWINSFAQTDLVRVALCSNNSFSPVESCNNNSAMTLSRAISQQSEYLDFEWQRLEDLKLDPRQELGDRPWWKRSN